MESGHVSGDFNLPGKLPAGNYYIRSYTAWMLNFTTDLFFYQKIAVIDGSESEIKKQISGHADFMVQFFPESGNLVSRLTSLVAFKAIDTNGLPVNISGKVFNNLGDTVALIRTVHDGMGSFLIHCMPQGVYTAIVTANGITKRILLPGMQTSGVVLHTESRNNGVSDSVFFHISRSGINKEKFGNLILCAQMENHFSVTKIHFNESVFNDPLDTILTAPYPLLLNGFGAGVLHLSVLDETGNVLANRLVFLYNRINDSLQLQPSTESVANGKKGFTISLPPDYKGTLAVSVTDADKRPDTGNHSAILTGIFLSSSVTSIVYTPEWYLNDIHPETVRALDVLLVTCKAPGGDLQKILNDEDAPIKYLPEKSIILKGRAFEMNGSERKPLSNGSLFFILKAANDSLTLPLNVLTDAAGFFTVPDLQFHDTANIYVQTGVKVDGRTSTNIAIEFYKDIIDSISRTSFVVAPAVLNRRFNNNNADSPAAIATINDQHGMLKNVTIIAKGKTHLDSMLAKYATGIFANPGAWAQTLDLTNDPITLNSDQDVLAWLNGKVAGLIYAYSRGKPLIYWRYSNIIAGLSWEDQIKLNSPSFFLNEALLNAGPEGYDGAVQLLSGIRMADVALIRIFKPGTMQNVPDNGPHGSIAIYLKNGTEMDKPVTKINFEKSTKLGYKISQRFVNLNNGSKGNSTLYWNPALDVDPVIHTASFSFYINGTKHFKIVAEGLDENGKVVTLTRVVQ
ncbi:MAG: hypothetical protein ABJB86_06625 [Bacteroidota bacterium]